MSILAEIKKDAEGVMLLADWLGDGGLPVPQPQSEHRSSICTAGHMGQPCPANVEPNWWDRMKNAVAETIRKELVIKNNLGYATSRDGSLHMCKVCGCCMQLKVHVPIEHIREHTNETTEAALPNFCWMKHELDNLKQPTQ